MRFMSLFKWKCRSSCGWQRMFQSFYHKLCIFEGKGRESCTDTTHKYFGEETCFGSSANSTAFSIYSTKSNTNIWWWPLSGKSVTHLPMMILVPGITSASCHGMESLGFKSNLRDATLTVDSLFWHNVKQAIWKKTTTKLSSVCWTYAKQYGNRWR